jgi:hypothetical protein
MSQDFSIIPASEATLESVSTTLNELLASIQDGITFNKNVLDAFGKLETSSPETIFDSKQIADKQPLFFDDQQVSGAGTSSTYNTNQASTTLAVSNLTAGKRVRQTFRWFNYQPGKSQLIMKTFKLETKKAGIKIKDGYFNDRNGIFFYTHADSYGVGVRTYTSGVAVDNLVPQSTWNIDKLDGTGINNPSGLNLADYQKALFFIDFEWLGVGIIATGFYFNRKKVYCNFYDTADTDPFVTMSNPCLPVRTEIENDGTGVAASTTHICSTVISEGGLKDTGFGFGISRGTNPIITLNNTNIYPLFAVRLNSNYLHATIKLLNFNINCTSTATYNWYLLLNPTVTGTALSFTQVANTSVDAQINTTNATTVSGGTVLLTGTASQTNESGINIVSATDFGMGSTIAGVSDVVVLAVQRATGTTETFYGSLNWREQQ